MTFGRRNPDELLDELQAADANARRGKLKIFFGYAAGVGKTYAMLEAARKAQEIGRDVVVGYVESHGRRDTEALLEGLEAIPTRKVQQGEFTSQEFDIDAALARHPDLLLVDELAHTNADGSRHAKRWQDVVELLEAGIHVWTTLNVQHIESLNDIVGQITGVTVRETVPDHILELAEDLELEDLTPEELLVRIQEGKVYLPAQAERAMQHFFQKSNLVALRELSLRQTARKLHSDVESARRQKSTSTPWATADRILVCVGPSPTTARVIRTAKRLAMALDAPWIAACVELPGIALNSVSASQVVDHLRLAEKLGAETTTLKGTEIPNAILDFARNQNVTKILIGKTHAPRWRRWLKGGVVDALLEKSGEIDVYVIQGKEEFQSFAPPALRAKQSHWRFAYAASIVGVATILASILAQFRVAEANLVMIFLAGVGCTAYQLGRGPAIFASIASVVIFDFCFVPPVYSFSVADTQYLFTFSVMLAIGVLISTLTSRLRIQLEKGAQRERRTAALYRLGKQMSALSGKDFLASAAGQYLREFFGGEITIYLGADDALEKQDGHSKQDLLKQDGHLKQSVPAPVYGMSTSFANDTLSISTAHWVMTHDQIAGKGTDTLPNAGALFVPLSGSQAALGAIAIKVDPIEILLQPDQRQWLENCANQLALALERDRMAIRAADARVKAEAEEVRSTLLSGVSHDLKTPLAAIAGASSTLLQLEPEPSTTQYELLETISEEANRLNRLLENILQITRLDANGVTPNHQWHLVEEIIGSALQRTKNCLAPRQVKIELPRDLPLIWVDGLMIEQVFQNIFENAGSYTQSDAKIEISAKQEGSWLIIVVADNGPGLPVGGEKLIFERYYRASGGPDSRRGSGLGLAICRAIVGLHCGTIEAVSRQGGGVEFVIRLPLAEHVPHVAIESQ